MAHGAIPMLLDGLLHTGEADLFFEGNTPVTAPDEQMPARPFKFCRMFPDLAPFRPDSPDGLIQLGLALEFVGPGASENNPNLPGGMTYLGQFVDHDITADRTEGIPEGELDPSEIEQGRSPVTDMDNLYGRGPEGSSEQYDDDKVHLRVGPTTASDFGGGNVGEVFPNDLPRRDNGEAIIGDGRNDENLAVAQTHLAFIKFHNKIVDEIGLDFEAVRDTVRLHYQSIVLHDFVKRLCRADVFDDVLENGPTFFTVPDGEMPCMPVEFSVAAYRLGHTMVRDEYEWNRVFNRSGIPGTLKFLFEFSHVSGKIGRTPQDPTLQSNWIVDWTRLHDFSDIPGVDNNPASDTTHLIDTKLAEALGDLPEIRRVQEEQGLDLNDPRNRAMRSLATRNLLRGRVIGLPTGQDVAAAIGASVLSPDEVADGKQSDIIRSNRFDTQTPLFYYVLKEAQVREGGKTLGEVGSRIVMETFHALISGSTPSLLKQTDWKPNPVLSKSGKDHYTMADLLAFVDDLNPLGN